MRNTLTHIARSFETQRKEDEAVQTSAMHERIMRYVTFSIVVVVVTLLLTVVPFIWVSFQHAIGNRIIIINHLKTVLCSLRFDISKRPIRFYIINVASSFTVAFLLRIERDFNTKKPTDGQCIFGRGRNTA